MRRIDQKMIVLARTGDAAARCEVGRRYLLGVEGFPKNVRMGLEYLTHASLKDTLRADEIISECLSLEDIVEFEHEAAMQRAANRGSPSARVKLAMWLLTRSDRLDTARSLLASVADLHKRSAAATRDQIGSVTTLTAEALFKELARVEKVNAIAVWTLAAREALGGHDLDRLGHCLAPLSKLPAAPKDTVSELVVAGLKLAAATGGTIKGLAPDFVQQCLEAKADADDLDAAYMLGRMLAGQEELPLDVAVNSSALNLRQAAALLLRAADGGESRAWMSLYRLHADHRSSVANAQMARFFLEKAAEAQDVVAQRTLGSMILRRATSLRDSERAIHWLHLAHSKGDAHATEMLATLVLPVPGELETAQMSADAVRSFDPFLASRLMLARHFGLTKQEALTVDPRQGIRPWGIVVEQNKFIAQERLSAPRAIPAVTEAALVVARTAAQFYSLADRDPFALEGNWRQRNVRLRHALDRFDLDESVFFASASSRVLDTYRLGPKWAFRTRHEGLQYRFATNTEAAVVVA